MPSFHRIFIIIYITKISYKIRAVEADLHVPVPFLSRTVCTLAEAAPLQEVPVHLLGRRLVGNVLGRITIEQIYQLAGLLTEFHDVLARSEIDLWDFTD